MSTLASLLVRDQVVPVRRIEEAIERQVVSGVSLATALAELGAAPENVLAAYAAAASGLEPLPREALRSPPAELLGLLDAEQAAELRVVPVARTDEGVVVALDRPLQAEERERLEALLGATPIEGLVLEPRLAAALQTHYGVPSSRKLARIARRLDAQPEADIPEVAPPEAARLDPLRRRRVQLPGRGIEQADAVFEGSGTQRFAPVPDAGAADRGPERGPATGTAAEEEPQAPPAREDVSRPAAPSPAASPAESGSPARPPSVQRSRAVAVGSRAPAPAPTAAPGRPQPLGVGEALEALERAADRDAVVDVLWRIAATGLRRLALFAVKGASVELRRAWPGGTLRTGASVPLQGLLEEARHSGAPVLRAEPGADDAGLLEALGERVPGPALAVPVAIRGRTVLLLGGDREGERFGLQDVAELLAVLPRVAEAFERVIRQRKLQGFRAGDGTGRLAALGPRRTVRLGGRRDPAEAAGGPWRAPEQRPNRKRRATVLGMPPAETTPPPPGEPDATPSPTPAPVARDSERPAAPRRPASFDRLGVPRTPPPPPLPRPVDSDAGLYSGRSDRSDALPALRRSSRPPPSGSRPPGRRRSQPVADPRVEGAAPPREEVVRLPGHVSSPPPEREADRRTEPPRAPRSLRDEGSRVIVDMGDQVNRLVQELLRSSPDEPIPAIDRLLQLGEAAIPALTQAFPGPLWFDRRHPHRRRPRGEDVSPVARALVAFGRRAAPYLVGLLGDPDPDTRYYALLVARSLPHARLVEPVGARLLDEDAGVRVLAAEVLRTLSRYREQLDELLEALRYRASDRRRDVQERVLALRALGALRDAESLEALLEALGSRDESVSLAAHDALVAITRQDFGRSVRRWRQWVERNRSRHRIEWLIDALTHPEESIRKAAGRELGELTRQYLGFHPSLPKRDREVCQRKYRAWWEREGRVRFAAG